jgi:hypothetical protein
MSNVKGMTRLRPVYGGQQNPNDGKILPCLYLVVLNIPASFVIRHSSDFHLSFIPMRLRSSLSICAPDPISRDRISE